MQISIRRKAGALRSGSDSRVWHAVELGNESDGPSLCGQIPRIQWSDREGDAITCPRCRRIQNARQFVADTCPNLSELERERVAAKVMRSIPV
jgi:hypothetical protein